MENNTPYKHRAENCRNCKTDLKISDRFCNYCGQKNNTKKLNLSDFFNEFASSFYAYDGKFNTSIKTLITKPSVLAKEYISGKRHKYANPFRLFLSLCIIFYLSTTILPPDNSEINDPEVAILEPKEKEGIYTFEYNSPTDTIQPNETGYTKKEFIKYHKDSIYSEEEMSLLEKNRFKSYISIFKNAAKKYPNSTTEAVLDSIGFEKTAFNTFVYNKANSFKTDNYFEEIGDFLYKNLALILFLCVPVIAFMFYVVCYSKKLNYTEHLVFTYSFYSFIILGLLLIIITECIELMLPEFVYDIIFFLIVIVIFPIYLYKSIKNFYNYTRKTTFIKLIALHILFVPLAFIIVICIILFGLLLF